MWNFKILLTYLTSNKYIECARANEEGKLVRVAKELLQQAGIVDDANASPRAISQRYLQKVLKTKFETFENKQLHGYVQRKVSSDQNVDQIASKEWLTNRYTSSHFEAYACAIQEGEIGTKDLIYRQDRKNNIPTDKTRPTNVDCAKAKSKTSLT